MSFIHKSKNLTSNWAEHKYFIKSFPLIHIGESRTLIYNMNSLNIEQRWEYLSRKLSLTHQKCNSQILQKEYNGKQLKVISIFFSLQNNYIKWEFQIFVSLFSRCYANDFSLNFRNCKPLNCVKLFVPFCLLWDFNFFFYSFDWKNC